MRVETHTEFWFGNV